MPNLNNSQKVRFFPMFPYGLCSHIATTLEGKNTYASRITLIGAEDDFLEQGDRRHKNNLKRVQYLTKLGYVRDTKYTCGSPSELRRFRMLTQDGICALATAPQTISAEDVFDVPNDGDIKGKLNCDGLSLSAPLQNYLDTLAVSNNASAQKAFASLLLQAVRAEVLTPFAYAAKEARAVNISTTGYSLNQLYNIWRISHINAMFRANGHLTNLDRRPYDTGFAVDGITSPQSYADYIEKRGHTPASISYFALNKWYQNNPDYYTITQTEPAPGEAAYRRWLATPVFYDSIEMRRIDKRMDDEKKPELKGSKQTLFAIYAGVAFGKKCNYICYHGKPGPFKWIKYREENTIYKTVTAIHRMKTANPDIPWRDSVEYGLYFCSSQYQFAAIFDKTIEKHKKKQKCDSFDTDEPFTSLHAVPVNDSGTFELLLLMEMAPVEAENRIYNKLETMDEHFIRTGNPIYPFLYKNRRVFLGHLMDIRKINYALVDYLNGHRFHICCLPEQFAYYRQLFPDLEFL